MKYIIVAAIKAYRTFSRFLFPNPVCRFDPSCSEYALGAISRHGAFKGAWMSAYRVMRCNPFCRGGYDPVK